MLFIDDFDQCPLNDEARSRAHVYFQTGFAWRILTVGGNFEMTEAVQSSKLSFLGSYTHYRILPLGYERRGELVRRWNSLGNTEVTTTNQWLESCYQTERLIEAARLQHVATTVPIMVLSLLQANSSGVPKDMRSSSFAHYFHFLIVGALKEAGVATDDFGRYLAFGMHLSWFIKNSGSDFEISEAQFGSFCNIYSAQWTRTDGAAMLNVLVESRILDKHGDVLCFAYQYTYYYFLGMYTSKFVETVDVQAYIDYCMKNLYVRECANTLLFLAHHAQDDYVLDRVLGALSGHFRDTAPATFAKQDVQVLAGLISGAPALSYLARDPVKNRETIHKLQDEMDTGHDGLADAPSISPKGRVLVEELISLTKTMEVAGILLTNQFSDLSREKKNESITLIFQGALRVISDFFLFVKTDPERLVQEIAGRLNNRKHDLLSSDAEIQARHVVAWLIRMVATSWVMKAGQQVSSPNLADNVSDAVNANSTLAMRLIQIGQFLDGPRRLPQAAIKAVIREENDNPFVMGCLQLLILNRLYMYETHHEDKHWAISTFDLAGTKNRLNAADRRRKSIETKVRISPMPPIR